MSTAVYEPGPMGDIGFVRKFGDWVIDVKRYCPNTAKSYVCHVSHFRRYLLGGFSGTLIGARTENVQGFRDWLVDCDYSAKSIGAKLSALRLFYAFCRECGAVESNPVLGVARPARGPLTMLVYLSRYKADELVYSIAAKSAADIFYRRDVCMVELLYQSGLTGVEVCSLCNGHVNLSNHEVLHIPSGYGKPARVVGVPLPVIQHLKQYCEIHHQAVSSLPNKPFFLNRFLGSISDRSFRRRLVMHARAAGIALDDGSDVTPKVLRNLFIHDSLHSGVLSFEQVMIRVGLEDTRGTRGTYGKWVC